MGEEQTVGEKKEWIFRERTSTLSLEFPAIEPSVFGDRTVGFRRSKKQSCSPRQGLRVGTGFVEFR